MAVKGKANLCGVCDLHDKEPCVGQSVQSPCKSTTIAAGAIIYLSIMLIRLFKANSKAHHRIGSFSYDSQRNNLSNKLCIAANILRRGKYDYSIFRPTQFSHSNIAETC